MSLLTPFKTVTDSFINWQFAGKGSLVSKLIVWGICIGISYYYKEVEWTNTQLEGFATIMLIISIIGAVSGIGLHLII